MHLLPLLLLSLSLQPLTALSTPLLPSSQSLSLEPPPTPVRKDYTNRLILIRHGEKYEDGRIGLSPAGVKRAQCLRGVFGKESKHNIGLIMAENYRDTGKRIRPFKTVEPLAKDLGLEVDLSCERDDAECVREVVKQFTRRSDKDVLICWKHSFLSNIAESLGSSSTSPYPDDRFDILWIMKQRKIVSRESEKCEGIDDERFLTESESGDQPDQRVGSQVIFGRQAD